MEASPGAHVTEHVTLRRPLGNGAMGTVWLAHHAKLDAEVAVKIVDRALFERDPRARERFRREATLTAQLRSPHVVRVFDHGELADGRPFLVMERLVGESLAEHLGRVETLAPEAVVELVAQVGGALDEAHGLGIVHRDVKPENLFLVEANGELCVKLLDFGVAKRLGVEEPTALTLAGALVGTPDYMSPEELLARDGADAATDRWALAVVAYRCLVGRAPFSGETLPALTLAICHGDHDPPSELGDLPPALDAWFARAFASDAAARFDGGCAMADELGRVLGVTRRGRIVLAVRPAETASKRQDGETLPGAATELATRRGRDDASNRGFLLGAVALAAGVAVASAALWERALPERPVDAQAGAPTTIATERLAPAAEEQAPERTLQASSMVAPTSAPPRPEATASMPLTSPTLATSSSATRGRPVPPKPATSTRPGCENPFELDAEGDLVPRAGCM